MPPDLEMFSGYVPRIAQRLAGRRRRRAVAAGDRQLQQAIASAIARLTAEAQEILGEPMIGARTRRRVVTTFSRLAWVDLEMAGRRLPVVIKTGVAEGAGSRLAREYEATLRVQERLAGVDGCLAPRVLAFFPEVPALVTEEVPGRSVAEVIDRDGARFRSARRRERLESICFGAGVWLRRYQDATVDRGALMCLDEMLVYVDVRLKLLVAMGQADVQWRERVLGTFERIRPSIPSTDLTLSDVHGDFSPANILHTGTAVVPIDFAMSSTGSIYYDLTRFHHQLGLFLTKPSFRPTTIRRLQRAFLQGYGRPIETDSGLFRLFIIQHVLCHWLGRLKTTAVAPHVRAYNWWVCRAHRRTLDGLLAA
jgi:hypothetical protein